MNKWEVTQAPMAILWEIKMNGRDLGVPVPSEAEARSICDWLRRSWLDIEERIQEG